MHIYICIQVYVYSHTHTRAYDLTQYCCSLTERLNRRCRSGCRASFAFHKGLHADSKGFTRGSAPVIQATLPPP